MKRFQFSHSSLKNRHGVDPRLIAISDLALEISLIDFGHGPDSGLRSAERQEELFLEGKSLANGHSTKSKHQLGRALDFYAYVDGKASWEPLHLSIVAAAFMQAAIILGYKIRWGGLWRKKNGGIYGWDMPHIELID